MHVLQVVHFRQHFVAFGVGGEVEDVLDLYVDVLGWHFLVERQRN